MASEEEVKYEMDRALLEWGVDVTRGKRHLEYYRTSMKQVLQSYRGEQTSAENNKADQAAIQLFNMDPEKVARHLLTADFTDQSGSSYKLLSDLLADASEQEVGTSLSYVPPFVVKFDRHWKTATKSSHYKIQYDMKADFNQIKRVDLDPFVRFYREEVPPARYHFNRFSNEDYLLDVAFEAIVVFHAVNHEVCRSCIAKGSLQWKSHVHSKWNHIECKQCNSTYTMQSRECRVKGDVEHKRIAGGSFSSFHQMSPSNVSTAGKRKHYIVLSSQESSFKPSDQSQVMPVQIAEIDSVIPRLVPDSFPSSSSELNIPIFSWIRIVPKTRKLWFNATIEGINIREWAQSAYNQYFPGEWNRLSDEMAEKCTREDEQMKTSDTEDTEHLDDSQEQASSTPEKQVVDKLKNELEQMKAGSESDADWEDCYASD